jgi:hypothetical protein
MTTMGCAIISSGKYFVVQNNDSAIYETTKEDWVTKGVFYGTVQPALHVLKITGDGELVIYPICIGRLELFGPPFLPIIWAPKWASYTGDPMIDKNNLLRFMYSGKSSDIRLEKINGISGDDRGIKVREAEKNGMLFLEIPASALEGEVLIIEMSVNRNRRVLEFRKMRTTYWHPLIAPL